MKKNEVFSAYYAADLMLFPSKTETQGLTAVESIMCGTPVIGLNQMGIKNVIENGESGLLTNENIDEFSTAALSLINNTEKRKQMSIQSKNRGKVYSYESIGKKLEKIYEQLVKTN